MWCKAGSEKGAGVVQVKAKIKVYITKKSKFLRTMHGNAFRDVDTLQKQAQ